MDEAEEQGVSKSELALRLGIARSTLYYKPKRPELDEQLRLRIEAVMVDNPGYGHRRVADALLINRKRARRVMKKFGLKPARRASTPRKPEDRGLEPCSFPDILSLFSPIAPGVVWIADFTYINFHGSFVYLATVLDRFTAEVLGVNIRTDHSQELVIGAFLDAISRCRGVPEYLHSDQGSEYRAEQALALLAEEGINVSMSPKASPWRNGAQESFFGRFKVEFGDPNRFTSLPELVEAIYSHVAYYNNERIHTRLRTAPRKFTARWEAEQAKIREKVQSAQKLPRPASAVPPPQVAHTCPQSRRAARGRPVDSYGQLAPAPIPDG
ncbi:MAG: IS3 family transposase [Bdellovibrionota bacterium]